MRCVLVVVVVMVLLGAGWSGCKRPRGEPDEAYLKRCTALFVRKQAKKFCTCLWLKGVEEPGDVLLSPAARDKAKSCE